MPKLHKTSVLTLAFFIWLFLTYSLSARANDTILVLGDSISAAFGMDPSQGWVALLEKKLETENYQQYQVVNASVSGNTTGDGLARLPALLEQYQPTIVIVELGGNDGLRGYPVKLIKRNLQQIIDEIFASNAKVLLAGIEIPPNYGQAYTDLFRNSFAEVAANNPVVFMPFVLKDIAVHGDLMQADGIHPNSEAQPVLLNNLWEYLQKLL